MLFPTLIVDNFFKYPERVVDFSNNITYERDKEYKWPGKRSKEIHEINQNFFIYFDTKVLSVLYPMNYKQISFNLSLKFQKISSDYKNNFYDATGSNGECDVRVLNTSDLELDLTKIGFKNIQIDRLPSYDDYIHTEWLYIQCEK